MSVMLQKPKKMLFLFSAAHKMSRAHLSKQRKTPVYSAYFLNTAGNESRAAGKVHQLIGAFPLSNIHAFTSIFVCKMLCKWDIMMFFGSSPRDVT